MASVKKTSTWIQPPAQLSQDTLNEVEWRLRDDPDVITYSPFSHRKRSRKLKLASLESQLPTILEFEPSCILFTAFSATPLADVFRGIYDSCNLAAPNMGAIDARKHGPEVKIPGTGLATLDSITNMTLQRVVVVDQFIATGETLMSAIKRAGKAGAGEILPITGKWYHSADGGEAGFEMMPAQLTSNLAEPLKEIGRKIATNIH